MFNVQKLVHGEGGFDLLETSQTTALSTLVDYAYQNIRQEIITEALPADAKINLNDLCSRYQISPTPIKQALNRLIAEGLVDNIPRRGFRVHTVSWKEVDEMLEMRIMYELYFAEQATNAVRSDPSLQSKFEENLDVNMRLIEECSSTEEYFQVYEQDRQFHKLLIYAGGNSVAVRTYESLNTHAYAIYIYGRQPREETINGILEHRAIFEAMRDGDSERVHEHIKRHIENARGEEKYIRS